MTLAQDPDVIIAGAGIAGATLALSLAQAGLRPVLIDPVVFDDQLAPTFDGRASAIAYSAYRQWRALGLADALDKGFWCGTCGSVKDARERSLRGEVVGPAVVERIVWVFKSSKGATRGA